MNIETNYIVKKYGKKTVLNLNGEYNHLLFESGKIHGIIGPNGAGKTVLMKIIAGLVSQTEGEILYNGQTFSQSISLNMTCSNQYPVLFARSIYENIAYPLRIRKYREADIKIIVGGLLEEFQIADIQNQSAKNISGGEAQKTALARALSFSPRVLFLDEPTASIDPKSIQVMEAALIRRNVTEGLTVIIVTHNLSQAFRICNQLLFLNQGQCLFSGTRQNLTNSSDPVIQEFISSNLFEPVLN